MRQFPRFRLALFAAASLFPAGAALAQGPAWETFGPPLYQVNAVATPAAERTVYAASADSAAGQSAIFRSIDAGNDWTGLVQAQTGELYADLLADRVDAGTLYAGAPASDGTTKIYQSTNGGGLWLLGQIVPTFCVPSFAQGVSTFVFLACGTHLYKTTGHGAAWTELPTPFTEAMRLTSGASGLLLAYSPTHIFKSTDSGANWTAVGNAPAACAGINVLRVSPSNSNVLVAGTGLTGPGGFQCGGIFRSTNGGTSWTAGSLSGVYVSDVVIDSGEASRVYASAGYVPGLLPKGGVFSSPDGGATWTDMQIPVDGAARVALSASGAIIYAATSLGVYQRSVDINFPTAPRAKPIRPPGSPNPRVVSRP